MKKKLISALLIFALLVAFVPYGLPTAQAAGSPSDFSWDNATVYFLLTDRFYNGNPANDHSYGRGLDQSGKVVQGIDPSATFHGGDFAGITKKIEEGYFTDLGVNAIWLSAPYEQIHGYVPGWGGDCFPHFGYHGYYALDYTQPDANFGTKAEFKTMVDTAHEYGIRIVLDVVMNHAGYVTLKDMDEYGFGSFNGSWQSHYYSYKPNLNTYTNHINYSTDTGWSNWWGRDWVRVSGADDGRKPPSYDGPGSTDETMCLSNLPDFKTETTNTVSVPVLLQNKWTKEGRLTQETDKLNAFFTRTGRPKTVTNHLVAWLSEWVREYGIDGFRCDTAKHIEMAAWKALKDECVEALRYWKGQNPTKKLDDLDFWMTGETWNWNIGSGKDRHFTQGGFDSMINFETQGAGLLSASNVAGTHARYATSINTTAGFNVLSYVSSHDTVRASGDRIAIGSGLLLLPGAVQIYYGDETGLPLDSAAWPGSDHRLRGDMNWNSMDGAALEHWQLVGTFRGDHVAVGAGTHTQVTPTGGGYAFTRVYGSDKVAACINAPKNTNISIPVGALWGNGTTLMNAYDGSEATVTGGSITFNSGKNGTVLVQEPDNSPRVTLVGDTSFKTDTHELTVSLKNVSSAKISIDGGPETTVTNGQKITIGAAAAYGATISVKVSWESEGKTVTRTFSYKKLDPNAVTHARVHIQPVGGSAPYLHMWTASVSHVLGAWPGTQLTQKDADGWWVIDVPTVEGAYNIVVNNGSGAQSGNIEGLEGEVWIAVPDGDYTKARVTDSPGPTASPTPTGATPTPTPSPSPTPIPTPTSEFAYSIHIYDWNDTPQLTELSNKELPALTFSDPISSANKWRSVSFTSTQNRLDLELQWGGNGRTIFSRTNSGGPIGHVGRFTLTAEYPNVYLFSGGPAGADINPYSTVYVSPVAAVGDKLTMRFSVLSYQQPITLSAKNFASPWTPMTMQESAAIPAQLVPTGESANEYMRLYTYSHDYAPGSYPDEFKITRQSRLYPGGENNGAPLTAAAPKDNAFVIVSAAGLSNLKVGVAVTGSVSFTVDNGTWASAIAPSAFTVTGLPAGLTAGAAVRTSDTVVTVPVTGIPTTAGSGGLALGIPTTVPAANITGAWGAIPILGTVSTGVVAKGDRPAPSAPTLSGKTESTIVIVNATDMEYAINTVNVAPAGGWQSGGAGLMTFSGLAPDTAYFIFARRPGNANYNNSVASPSLAVTTDKTAIASVAVAVTGPSTGAAPNTAAVPAAGSNFTAGPVSWSPTATVFAGSTQYTATVKLTPNAGESFAGGVNATINGFAAGVVYNADGTITLSYQFAATSAKTITGIAIVTQPAKLAYTSGEKLDLNGLSVRLTFSDNSTETVAFAAFAASNISTGPANGTAITAALNGTTIRVYVGSFSANTNAISVNKATGAAVNAPAAVSVTSRSVTVSSSLQTATGQTIEYAVSTSSTAPATGWQDSSTFSGLAPDTEYWFFARSKENADCNTGPVSTGTRVKTNVTPAVTLRGDANVDNQVNAADAAAILRHLVQLQLLTEQGERNAKVTPGDGPISAADAARILRWLVQLIEGDL